MKGGVSEFFHAYMHVDLTSYCLSYSSLNSGSSPASLNSSSFAMIFWILLSSSCTIGLKISSISSFLESTWSNPFTSLSCDSLISSHFGAYTCFTHYCNVLETVIYFVWVVFLWSWFWHNFSIISWTGKFSF